MLDDSALRSCCSGAVYCVLRTAYLLSSRAAYYVLALVVCTSVVGALFYVRQPPPRIVTVHLTSRAGVPCPLAPRSRRVACSTSCACPLGADWGLRSNVVTDLGLAGPALVQGRGRTGAPGRPVQSRFHLPPRPRGAPRLCHGPALVRARRGRRGRIRAIHAGEHLLRGRAGCGRPGPCAVCPLLPARR